MKRTVVLIFVVLPLFIACGHNRDGTENQANVPDEVDFSYLNTAGERLLAVLHRLRDELDGKRRFPEARRHLAEAEERALILVCYAIPITEIRRQVDDARRLHARRRPDAAVECLRRAEIRLREIGSSGGTTVERAVREPIVMIETLRMEIERRPTDRVPEAGTSTHPTVDVRFRELRHKIDLMASRDDLVLSGATFRHE
ncbi:MAG: hypothetical protein JW781_10210 [Deltaproteobacteria bacterium]|nr:hypothetical protein [Candidatus Anaeroferrophillacea bacterium]